MKKFVNFRSIMVGLGGLAILALVAYQLYRGGGFGQDKRAVLIVAMLFIMVGALGQRIKIVYSGLAVFLLTVLILGFLLNYGAIIYLNLMPDSGAIYERSLISDKYLDSQDWGGAYWQGFRQRQMHYKQYTEWAYDPLTSEAFSIDENGLRFTPDAQCDSPDLTVWVFGGSTIWGDKTPDFGTIPAQLQTILAEEFPSQDICVVNFGQRQYVFNQNVVDLTQDLQTYDSPDIAIFYYGLTDVFSSYIQGDASRHHNWLDVPYRFNTPLVNQLMTKTALARALEQLNSSAPAGMHPNASPQQVSESINNTMRIAETLADGFEFEAYFVLQPVIQETDKALIPDEQIILKDEFTDLIELFNQSYETIREAQSNHPRFTDLSDVFDDNNGWVWIDRYHLTTDANRIIAQEMADMLAESEVMASVR